MSKNSAVPVMVGSLGTVDDFIQYLLDSSLKLGSKLETKIIASKLFSVQRLTDDTKYPGFKVAVYHTTEGIVILVLRLNKAQRIFQPNISLSAIHHFEVGGKTERFAECCTALENLQTNKQVTSDVILRLVLESIK